MPKKMGYSHLKGARVSGIPHKHENPATQTGGKGGRSDNPKGASGGKGGKSISRKSNPKSKNY